MTKNLRAEIAAISIEEIILRAREYILDGWRMKQFIEKSRVAMAEKYKQLFRDMADLLLPSKMYRPSKSGGYAFGNDFNEKLLKGFLAWRAKQIRQNKKQPKLRHRHGFAYRTEA
jgi:hypothetical protein